MSPNTSLTPRQMVRAIFAVAAGGAIGTLIRDGVTSQLDPSSRVARGWTGYAPLETHIVSWVSKMPWALLSINALGVFFVALLLRTRLRGHDPNDLSRLVIVTGFFGGLTSYSGLFADVAGVWHQSRVAGFVVIVGAVISGVAAAQLGLWVARHR